MARHACSVRRRDRGHRTRCARVASTSIAVAMFVTFVSSDSAAQARTPLTTPGYSTAAAAAERALEATAIARPDASVARTHSQRLSAETHVAGSRAQERTRDYVIQQMHAMGLETEV